MSTRSVSDWASAKAAAKVARDKDYGYILDHSTRVRVSKDKHGGRGDVDPDKAVYAIVHFSTEVVYYYPDGRVGINLHGWDTVTTKRRVQQYTPARMSSGRRGPFIYTYRAARPIDTFEEYILSPDGIIDMDGLVVKDTSYAGMPRPLPKSRNTVRHPKRGDVFRSTDGRAWIVVSMAGRSVNLGVAEYLGDLRVRRQYVLTSSEPLSMTPLLQMTMLDWTPVERFIAPPSVPHVA